MIILRRIVLVVLVLILGFWMACVLPQEYLIIIAGGGFVFSIIYSVCAIFSGEQRSIGKLWKAFIGFLCSL
jgi:hypothetical protein